MKKVLFVCYGLGIGGIEKCLVNLLNAMQNKQFDIDVLLMNPEYDSKPQISSNVNYLDSFQYVMNTTDTMGEIRQHGGILKNLDKFLSYCNFRIHIKLQKDAWKLFRPLPNHYDIAVAYSQNDFSPYYVIDKVSANRKVFWYHNGAYDGSGPKFRRDQYYYNQFDNVVAVSTDCAKMLQEKFHFKDGKLIILRNTCDAEAIKTKAKEFIPKSFVPGVFHIVTVGRMTSEKGANLALEACRQLTAEGYNICWHWVGDGNQSTNIAEQVRSLGLQEQFILEGNQLNPYPYINYADLYVQPSYYEAYSTTVTEARVLCKPIITTDVGGMRDQISDGVTGLIVPISASSIATAVQTLIVDTDTRDYFCRELKKEHFDQKRILEEYYKTIFA